jgi:hypothetical protein
MLLFLVAVVSEYGLQLCVFAGIRPLVVPIDGLQLLHQGNNGTMHIPGFI